MRAICTHAILSGNAYENINNSCIEELVVTDSLPLKSKSEKIKVLSVVKFLLTLLEILIQINLLVVSLLFN